MTQELIRDDSLPYVEVITRPGEVIARAFDWANWLANRWMPGIQFATNFVLRPIIPTGLEYLAQIGGMSGNGDDVTGEPQWPTLVGNTVADGAITWIAQSISNSSLIGTITGSVWTADSPLTVPASSLVGSRATGLISVGSSTSDGDYFTRNVITLSTGEVKVGTILNRVRAGKV